MGHMKSRNNTPAPPSEKSIAAHAWYQSIYKFNVALPSKSSYEVALFAQTGGIYVFAHILKWEIAHMLGVRDMTAGQIGSVDVNCLIHTCMQDIQNMTYPNWGFSHVEVIPNL